MISTSLQKKMQAAFKKGASVKATSWTILDHCFIAVRGSHNRFRSEDDFIAGFESEVSDSSHQFWISAFRSEFPCALTDNRKVTFDQGAYVTCSTDGRKYIIEHIVDDVDSPWLRFQLREI